MFDSILSFLAWFLKRIWIVTFIFVPVQVRYFSPYDFFQEFSLSLILCNLKMKHLGVRVFLFVCGISFFFSFFFCIYYLLFSELSGSVAWFLTLILGKLPGFIVSNIFSFSFFLLLIYSLIVCQIYMHCPTVSSVITHFCAF